MKTWFQFAGSLCLGLVACSLHAADEVWLQFPKGNAYALAERDGELSVRVPMVLDAKAPFAFNTLSVQVVDASIDSKREDVFFNAIAADLHPAAGVLIPTVTIRIGKSAPRAASYRIELQFLRSGPPVTPVQTAEFILSGGIPKLAAPSSLNVILEQPRKGPATSTNQVTLRETSKIAGFTDLTVKDISLHSEASNTGRLTTEMPTILAPDQVLPLHLSVAGEYPLGTGAGTLQVTARELSEAVLIPYTLKVRRPFSWIIYVSLSGFVLGYLSRVALKGWKELLAIRRGALELADLIRDDLANPDETLRQKLVPLETSLRAATRGVNAGRIQTLITSAQRTRIDALAYIENGRGEIVTALAPFDAIASQQWIIPPASVWLDELRAEVSRIDELRVLGDVTKGKAAVKKLKDQGLVTLVGNLFGWQRAAAAFLDGLPKVLPSLTAANFASFSAAVGEWEKNNGAPPITPPSVTVADVGTALLKAHQAWAEWATLRDNLHRWTVETTVSDAEKLKNAGAADVDFLAALQDYWKVLDVEFARLQPEPAAMAEALAALREKWLTTIIRVLPQATDTKEIQSAVENGKWQDALDTAVALLTGKAKVAAASFLGPDDAAAGGSPPVTTPVPDVRPGTMLTGRPHAARPTPTIADLEASEYAAGMIQTAIAAGIFLCGMYFSFRDSWVGTGPDIFKVFVAAFSADYATEALINAFKSK